MRERISVIVPIYHGEKYIKSLVHMIEEGAVACKDRCIIELVLSNDDPKCPLDGYVSNQMEIRIVETDVNRGIHGARVRGLKYCTGDYVVFLDQDDVIRADYIKSQYSRIGAADAVVCRLISGNRLHYTDTFRFEYVITKEFMFEKWCPIVSPGQVLIKKEAISNTWKKFILANNGADDYFLWLCMMAENKKFVLNQEILFEHLITGENTSENTNLMMDSEEEMLQILKRERYFDAYPIETLEQLRVSLRRVHIKQLETQRRALKCLNLWYQSFFHRGYVYNWMQFCADKKIAIYGAGELGMGLCTFLQEQGLTQLCYLDQNAEFILSDIPVYTMEEMDEKLDIILLTISDKQLQYKLEEKFNCNVVDVGDKRFYEQFDQCYCSNL